MSNYFLGANKEDRTYFDNRTINKEDTQTYILRFQDMLQRKADSWLENAEGVYCWENVAELVNKCCPIFCQANEIENIVIDCFRKHVLELIRTGNAQPQKSCLLLAEFAAAPNEGPNKDDELALQRIFSYFKRKQFDYFINRYYLFNEVNYNCRMERRIAKLMKGRGIAWPIRWKRTKLLTPGNTNYVGYLDSMPEFFLLQIGMKKELDSHPEADVWGMRQASYRMVRLMIVPYIILMILYIISKIV